MIKKIISIFGAAVSVIAGWFGFETKIIPSPMLPPAIVQTIPQPKIISTVQPKRRTGGIDPIPAPAETIIIDDKAYTPAEYADLKISLEQKIDAGTELKQDEGNNEVAQFLEAVAIEKEKCKGQIGAVDGNVVDGMNNLLKNGCPK